MNYLAKCNEIYVYEAENNTGNFEIIGGVVNTNNRFKALIYFICSFI